MGYEERAKQKLNQALKVDPSTIGAHRELGWMALKAGDHKANIEHQRSEYNIRNRGEVNVVNLIEARQLYHVHRHGVRARNYAELVNRRYWDRLQDGEIDPDPRAGEALSMVSLACDKCGTHFIADALQALTGQISNWQYSTNSDPLERYPSEPVEPGHFIAGNWYPTKPLLESIARNRSRVVLQYRDPRDQVVSGYFYCQKPDVLVNDTAFTKWMRALSKEKALEMLVKSWPETAMEWVVSWVESDVPLMLTTFEDMTRDKPRVAASLARYLDVPFDEACCQKVLKETDFNAKSASLAIEQVSETFKRKGVAGDWKHHFTPELVEIMKNRVGRLMVAFGFEEDLNWGP